VPSTGEYLPPPDPNNICSHFIEFYDGSLPRFYTTKYTNVAALSDINFDTSYSEQTLRPFEYEEYRKYFLNVPASTVRHTFDTTTLFYRNIPSSNHILNTFKSPYPALNVYRRHGLVASDTVYADLTAWGGITAAQVFVGTLSQYVAVYGCKSNAEFARTLEDEIRKRGAMDKLVTDRAQAEISKKVKDILRALFIQDWQSEAYYHQIIKELKKFANCVEWDELCDFIEEQVANENGTWNFQKICGHKKDLKARETPEVLIQWESGEITFEPINSIYDADPYLLAEYALDNDLLDEWQERCPRLKPKSKARNVKKMMRMINQAKL
jgi:hypothetical protein